MTGRLQKADLSASRKLSTNTNLEGAISGDPASDCGLPPLTPHVLRLSMNAPVDTFKGMKVADTTGSWMAGATELLALFQGDHCASAVRHLMRRYVQEMAPGMFRVRINPDRFRQFLAELDSEWPNHDGHSVASKGPEDRALDGGGPVDYGERSFSSPSRRDTKEVRPQIQ